jgi:hypothetical protein
MKRLLVCAAAVLFSTTAMAQAPATQQGSGQRAGGPAREAISETGGKKAPVKKATRQRSGQSAGGPAAENISATGGPVKPTMAPKKRAKSGQSAGGPRQ